MKPKNHRSPAAAKPETIQELREWVVAIKRGDAPVSMGKKALSVLGRLVERPEIVAVKTITELAQWLEVNASTLTRLSRTLGYSGFSDFQGLFRDEMTNVRGRFYSGQALRLLDEPDSSVVADRYMNAVIQLSNESVKNIEGCLAQLDADELRRVVDTLAQARQVRVYGVRQMHVVASMLAYGLGLIRPDVNVLGAVGQSIAENMAHMQKNDVLVVASVAPYSRSVVEAAQVARQDGITVIAMTDYRASPLAVQADSAFYIPHQSSFISNSMGAYIVFCESLINLVAKKLGARALRSLERQEQLIELLHIEAG